MNDTIFALATAPGRAAVAVLRVSGPGAGAAVKGLGAKLPPPREARLRVLKDVEGGELDRALVLWLPGPDSFTGEDVAELHLHGGVAVVEAVSEALLRQGLRPAEPGEFTRRAFEHGRLDLSQAEAVADLVDAETEAQRRQALAQLDGALSRRHEAWRELIVQALAGLEAAIDFPDEDLPADVAARAEPPLRRLIGELEASRADAGRGEGVREGYRVVLYGEPNAGKSTLLNALADREAAIVTPAPGTTRDVIEVALVLRGFKVVLSDTAGLRATEDLVESEGVRRAWARMDEAHLRLWVVDGGRTGPDLTLASHLRPGDLAVRTKTDLPTVWAPGAADAPAATWLETSTADPATIRGLREAISDRVVAALAGGEFPSATRARHRADLEQALAHAERALQTLARGSELAAEDVRLAGRALARITGGVDADTVLDRVFASFCIGK